GRLHGEANDDLLTVGDPAEHATRVVRVGAYPTVLPVGLVVVLLTGQEEGTEPLADLDALDRRDTEHRLPEQRVEFVSRGLTQPGRHVVRTHLHQSAETVFRLFSLENGLHHLFSGD